MNIILFKTLLLQGELIRASAENGFIMNKGNLIIQDVKRTSAGESLTWFMRIQKSVLHVFQLKYSIGIYYYFLMNTSWNKILKIEAMSNGTHFLLQQIYYDFIHPTKPGSFSREFFCKQSMQGKAAYHLFQSFKKVILCIIDEFISSLPKAKNLIFGK